MESKEEKLRRLELEKLETEETHTQVHGLIIFVFLILLFLDWVDRETGIITMISNLF